MAEDESYEHVSKAADSMLDEQYDVEEDAILSNRQKRQKPKGGLYWCGGCDMQIVRDWQKCKGCGYRNGVKRFKK